MIEKWKGEGTWHQLPSGAIGYRLFDELISFQPIYELSMLESHANPLLKSGPQKNYLVVTVRMSEAVGALCRQYKISYVDLWGSVYLFVPRTLYVEKDPRPKAGWHVHRIYKEPDVFSDRSSRIARCLLSQPGKRWSLPSLGKETSVSLGLVCRVMHSFRSRGWVSGGHNDWKLESSAALLEAWQKGDRWQRRVQMLKFTTEQVELETLNRFLKERVGERNYCFTQWVAARLRMGKGDLPQYGFYVRGDFKYNDFLSFGWQRGRLWGNLVALRSRDEGVFHYMRWVDGIPIVSDVQCFLDLASLNDQARQRAAEFKNWVGFCRKSITPP